MTEIAKPAAELRKVQGRNVILVGDESQIICVKQALHTIVNEENETEDTCIKIMTLL